jgi:hypothetical protein
MTAPQQETNGAPGRWVQHIYCSAIISKKMCDALTSYVFSASAAKGGIDKFGVYLITGGWHGTLQLGHASFGVFQQYPLISQQKPSR